MGLLRVGLIVAQICLVWIKGPIMGIDFRFYLSVHILVVTEWVCLKQPIGHFSCGL